MATRQDHETEPYQGCVRTQYNDESDSEKSIQSMPKEPSKLDEQIKEGKQNQPEVVDQKSSKCCLLI